MDRMVKEAMEKGWRYGLGTSLFPEAPYPPPLPRESGAGGRASPAEPPRLLTRLGAAIGMARRQATSHRRCPPLGEDPTETGLPGRQPG